MAVAQQDMPARERPVMESGPLKGEQLLNLTDAARAFPSTRSGAVVLAHTTVSRWITRGVMGPHRKRIYLQAIRVGKSWMTSREALARFREEMEGTAASEEPLTDARPRTTGQMIRAADAAFERLRRMGVKVD